MDDADFVIISPPSSPDLQPLTRLPSTAADSVFSVEDRHPPYCQCWLCDGNSIWSVMSLWTGSISSMYIFRSYSFCDESTEQRLNLDNHGLPVPGRHTSKDYEIAGRIDCRQEFKDLRSARRARRRLYAEKEKYYGFKGVKRGELGTKVYQPADPFNGLTLPVPEEQIVTLNKRRLFQSAQLYPNPGKHHYARSTCYCCKDSLPYMRRVQQKHERSLQLEEDLKYAKDIDFQIFVHGTDLQNKESFFYRCKHWFFSDFYDDDDPEILYGQDGGVYWDDGFSPAWPRADSDYEARISLDEALSNASHDMSVRSQEIEEIEEMSTADVPILDQSDVEDYESDWSLVCCEEAWVKRGSEDVGLKGVFDDSLQCLAQGGDSDFELIAYSDNETT